MQNTHPDIPATTPVFPGFEGPEKKLEIDFVFNTPNSKSKGLRSLKAEQWQNRVLNLAKCTIISTTVNKYFDSYVLSESSLFVYPTKIMIKTCGTTTLLKAVEPILQIANELDLSVLHVIYSRKNFNFPHVQLAPHTSWNDEVAVLDKHFNGNSYIMGPLNADHWHLYYADYSDKVQIPTKMKPEATFEVMMQDLCPKKMKQFYKSPDFKDVSNTTESSGIQNLLPGSIIDAFQFDPCGYSMNGLLGEAYSTIHITPEAHCSYVSYETNVAPTGFGKKTPAEFYTWLLLNVVDVFRPGRFTVTLFVDDHLPAMCKTRKSSSCFDEVIGKLSAGYAMKSKTMYELEGGCNLSVLNFVKKKVEKVAKAVAPVDVMALEKQLQMLGIIDDLKGVPQEKKKVNSMVHAVAKEMMI